MNINKFENFKNNSKLEPIRKSKNNKSKLMKSEKHENSDYFIEGKVVEIVGKSYFVEVKNEIYDCRVAGSIKSANESNSIVVVGDNVKFDISKTDDIEKKGSIKYIEERKTKLSRKAAGKAEKEQIIAANVDQVVIYMSAADPFYNLKLIDRYIVACEQFDLEAVIAINKIELMEEEFVKEDVAIYEKLGYKVYIFSLKKKYKLEEINSQLIGKTTLFTGPSGVGKSSFVNYILGESKQEVGKISERTTKGMHTTSSVKLYKFQEDSYIIDSPGIREFGIWDLEKEQLYLYYHDFDPYTKDCKYHHCTHTHEPECAIKNAVELGLIEQTRYDSYINIFESLK